MRQTLALGVAMVLPLAACAPQIPQISYDDPATLHSEPPKPVKIVQMPELLPLPGQLKRLPRGGRAASALEARDPARRVQPPRGPSGERARGPRSGSPRPACQCRR
jgi:type IV secretion system protein TrbG